MNIRCMNCMEEYSDEFEICPHCGYIRGTEPEEVYHLWPETILNGRYIIGVVVGFGGFGITYKAWDAQLEKVVAIKEYFPSSLVNREEDNIHVRLYSDKGKDEYEKGLERFMDEARSTAKFSKHPNIVNVFEYFEENGTAYIVMEYLEGLSLKNYIRENGDCIDYETAINISLSVIEALRSIHKEKILHRDISPDNIFICIPDKIKVIDFGAARISDEEQERTRSIVLKPGYAPPEQYRSKSKQGPWTDIYALGATLYHMVTGFAPEESSNREAGTVIKEPKEINLDIPDFLNNTIMMAMSINPELRFQNVDQMEEALLEQRKVTSLAENLRRRKKKRIITISIAAAIIMIGTIVSLFIFNRMKFDAELKPATVTVWIPQDDEGSEEQFLSRIEKFKQDYPHIEVEVTCIPHDEYYQRIAEAAKDDKLPTLFVSTYVDSTVLDETVKLDDVFKVADKNELFYMNDYKKYFPDRNQVPTGLNISMIYRNDKVEIISEENSYDIFLNDESKYYISGTDKYSDIQNNMGGKYSLSLDFPDECINACFVESWSVSDDVNHDEQAAGMRIISYLLGETGQDVYYVQDNNGVPLNKNVFKEYIDVNYELEILKDIMNKVVFDKSELFKIQDKCDVEYKLLNN